MPRKKKWDAIIKAKKKRLESFSDAQGPPQKKQALTSTVGRKLQCLVTPEPSEPHSFSPLSSNDRSIGTDRNHTVSQNLREEDENVEGEPGYKSLDLLEEILMEPSNLHVPSSLHTGKSHAQTGNESNGGVVQNNLPKLPRIKDPRFHEAPFTHQGIPGAAETVHQGALSMNYERLEFLGDAYLELIASRYILPRFPRFDPGKLSQTRQLLVCNETLASFSERYGFDDRARLPSEIQRKKGTSDKIWIKVMGDVFEAYVAALIISDPENGYATAEKWLADLWEPLLQRNVNYKVMDPMAKQILSTKIMTKGCKITYRDDRSPEPSDAVKGRSTFFISVYYTGLGWTDLHLGSGSGSNKTEAGSNAATDALRHPGLGDIMARKKKFDRQSKAKSLHER
ncbi:MAG: hypothetical protein L6R41_004971 [Letrouitia leprolyta]|nr:MAG: hypothetical protein L6R41_004971 [Letrouitia leprolyta]